MAKSPSNPNSFKALGRNIQYGIDTASPYNMEMGAMMGFMGLPYRTRPGWSHGNMGGPMTTIWPGGNDPRMKNGGGNTPTTGGDGPAVDPNNPVDPNDPNGTGKFAWSFPQYSQTWAFTPPEPTPYPYPQSFDPAKYGNPLAKKY